jgi:hypothetical protein
VICFGIELQIVEAIPGGLRTAASESDAPKHLPDLSLNIASEKPLSSPG